MKTSIFLLMLLFSLSCYSQKNFDVSFSISKEKETLFIHIENKSDSVICISNGNILHRIEDYLGSRVYISDQKKERYTYDEMFIPINTFEKIGRINVNIFPEEKMNPKQKKVIKITGIADRKKDILNNNRLYVYLDLTCITPNEYVKREIFEQWVPVE